jgi:pimeloyl-ACP methyl ester carboxylesterase
LLCIVGKDDVDVPWRIVQEEIRAYGGPVDFRLFENSHHMPFIDEEELFVETVTRFLSAE